MSIVLVDSFSRLFNPVWLTGPLFDKELRVSSRKRRNYLLRFGYIIFLTAFVAMAWLSVVSIEGSLAYQKSRMEVAGKTIVTTIITFQFMATQLIAVIMLSTAISDEIYHHTLGVLMTTPISSFQIVMGKLLSKLLQLILLLAITLPLLAIVRVFGGVPWDYILSSICITVTAVIFAGALSLFFSIRNRRAYVVIIKTVFTLAVIFAFIPGIISGLTTLAAISLRNPAIIARTLISSLSYVNPFGALSVTTLFMMSPSMPAGVPGFHWPIHCGLMLCLSALLVGRSVKVVRKVGLMQATGQLDIVSKRTRRKKVAAQPVARGELTGVVRRVMGWPVLWRELRAPMIQGPDRRNGIIGLIATVVALFLTYAMCAKQKCLDDDVTQVSYTLLFVFIGMIFHIVLSAVSITYEKESRAWPILLATSMDDWQILLSKAGAVFRRSAVIWLLLAGHVIIATVAGYVHPAVIIHLVMLVAWLAIFLTGAGLYFSSRLRRTTSAVVASFALALTLWAIIPVLLGMVSTFTHDESIVGAYLSANPIVQAGVIVQGAAISHSSYLGLSVLEYRWPFINLGFASTTFVLLVISLVYISLGVLFGWRAKCRFRRNIF